MRKFFGVMTAVVFSLFAITASAQMGAPRVYDVRCAANCGTGGFWTILGWLIGFVAGFPLLVALPIKSAKDVFFPPQKPFLASPNDQYPSTFIGRFINFLGSLIPLAIFISILHFTDFETLSALWMAIGIVFAAASLFGLVVYYFSR